MRLGIQSFCLRNTQTHDESIRQVEELGLSEIEPCRRHVDFYADAGVRIRSIGVNPITGDEAKDRLVFEFAKRAGIAVMSVTFPIPGASIDLGENLAAEYGVELAVHNHGGRDWLGSPKALEWLMQRTGDAIGICLDLAWARTRHDEPGPHAAEPDHAEHHRPSQRWRGCCGAARV